MKPKLHKTYRNRIKKIGNLCLYCILFISFFSCKEQKDDNILRDEKFNAKIISDKKNPSSELFKSKKLDKLFKKKEYNYLVRDYSGTSKENFSCQILNLFNKNKYIQSYALFFNNKDFLKDTLNVGNKDISLDITFKNNKKGIALGSMDVGNLYDAYFLITDLYELDEQNTKLKKINLNTEIKKCEIPIQYLSEEYSGIEDYFSFGIKKRESQNTSNISSVFWDGTYSGSFLRLKDESADSRAWGQIKLLINGKSAQLNIDTYVEIVQKDLEVINEASNQLRLKDSSSDYYLILKKEKNKIIMEGNLMESIIGISEKYEIAKTIN